MQKDSAEEMAKQVVRSLRNHLGEAVQEFYIEGIDENPNHLNFRVEFAAYNYFWIGLAYERGSFIASIITGDDHMILDGFMTWWEEIDLDDWIPKLAEDLRLRIPDKYLGAKGWL